MERSFENQAKIAAKSILGQLNIKTENNKRIGLVLGTGWGDALNIENRREVSFTKIPGFESLGHLEGHVRSVVFGSIDGQEVLALRGRIHLNEGHTDKIVRMVRLQTEMLFKAGVNKLIITSAVGSLSRGLPVGSIAVVNSFITLFAPPMPLWAGEFCSPEDMLDSDLSNLAILACHDMKLSRSFATHAMVRGPFFEGRKNDKRILRESGADVVGMSMLPEACMAAVSGVKVIGLGFVTNNYTEAHSHEENMARAKKSQDKLGALLTSLVSRLKE